MDRSKDSIYEFLRSKIMPVVEKNLTAEELVDLDGALWAAADMLCDENAPRRMSA